jgi:hypothetical protein
MRKLLAQCSQDAGSDPSPDMPDVPAGRAHRAFTIGPYSAVLMRDTPTIGMATGLVSSIRYLYALAVTKATDNTAAESLAFPSYLVTLEQGPGPEPFLCVFDHHGPPISTTAVRPRCDRREQVRGPRYPAGKGEVRSLQEGRGAMGGTCVARQAHIRPKVTNRQPVRSPRF